MSPQHVLIVYGTKYGQTAKIASRIANLLTAAGKRTTLMDANDVSSGLSPQEFDGVIVGSSIIQGKHRPSIRRFVERHRDALNAMPSAFFSVSGSAASHDERGRAVARQMLDDFVRATVWEPQLVVTLGGAMAFTKYNFVLRWVMKRISRAAGGPSDTTRDHELTDWDQVRRFTEAFAATLPVLQTS